jgi:cellulose synthase/poly-beta-1,6-N-acetylglucosamine synthase-like glycosyltransferase
MFYYLICLLSIITAFLCAAYVFLIGSFCIGWKRTNLLKIKSGEKTDVAIIVAARNEEDNILECLKSISFQTYSGNFEIIVVNDNSTDKTEKIISEFTLSHSNVKLINLSDFSLEGKKNAISTAIRMTNSELIITTDADCTMGNKWLETIVFFYNQTKAKMIVAPVAFKAESGVFQKMQSLEMLALQGSTCGSLYYGKAIMCNGANLAYKKSVFGELNGFKGIEESASGDDVLLMYKINEKYKDEIKFLKNSDAVVYTKPKVKMKDFIEQRKRWASKDFSLLNKETKIVGTTVYSYNFMILLTGIIAGFASLKSTVYQPFFEFCLILFGIKCLIDFLLLFLAASFFKKKRMLYLFLPEQLCYIVYVVLIGLLGKKGSYSWKGRKY